MGIPVSLFTVLATISSVVSSRMMRLSIPFLKALLALPNVFNMRVQHAMTARFFSCDAVAFEITAEYEWFLTNQGNQTDTSSSFCANVVASAAESPNNPPCAMELYDLLRAYAEAQGDWVNYPDVMSATGFDAVFNGLYSEVSVDDVRATEDMQGFCHAIHASAIFEAPATE